MKSSRNRRSPLSIILGLSLLLVLGWPPLLAADEAITSPLSSVPEFGIMPIRNGGPYHFDDLRLSPGESITIEAAVINASPEPLDLEVYLAEVSTAVNGGMAASLPDSEPGVPISWMDFAPLSLHLDGGERRFISISITVPQDTEPGQYVAALVAETRDSYGISGQEVFSQKLRYAIRVGVLVPGDVAGSPMIGEPDLVGTRVISIPVANEGNYWIELAGTVEFYTPDQERVAGVELETGIIFAGDHTSLQLSLPEQFPSGEYLLKMRFTDSFSDHTITMDDLRLTIPPASSPTGIILQDANVTPNAVDIRFAHIDIKLNNASEEAIVANLMLTVSRDGTLVERWEILTERILTPGENMISARYIPATDWESGTYAFRLSVRIVDAETGSEITILDVNLPDHIIVP